LAPVVPPEEVSVVESEPVAKLRREVRQLKLEREILAKATAWFARESGSIPDKDSNS
jgi:transposase